MQDQRAEIDWREAVPISRRFDDPYFSLEDGLAETAHVFLAGNGLPARFADGFQIAELGFGTGLNFLVTLQAWRRAGVPGRLRFTSFEAWPMRLDDMRRALRPFGALPVAVLAGGADDAVVPARVEGPDFVLEVVVGDARATVPAWEGRADAWYLDGFSPAKNPELWEPALLAAVAAHTVRGGTAASYTAAGHVRRALAEAGFGVTRVPGFARKRHMTCARMPD